MARQPTKWPASFFAASWLPTALLLRKFLTAKSCAPVGVRSLSVKKRRQGILPLRRRSDDGARPPQTGPFLPQRRFRHAEPRVVSPRKLWQRQHRHAAESSFGMVWLNACARQPGAERPAGRGAHRRRSQIVQFTEPRLYRERRSHRHDGPARLERQRVYIVPGHGPGRSSPSRRGRFLPRRPILGQRAHGEGTTTFRLAARPTLLLGCRCVGMKKWPCARNGLIRSTGSCKANPIIAPA